MTAYFRWKYQGSTLRSLFAAVMNKLTSEVRQQFLWIMMFADDTVVCSESREQVKKHLERWRLALERIHMKVTGSF